MKSILNPEFKYVHSTETTPDHLRRVFEKARREIAAEKAKTALTQGVVSWPLFKHRRNQNEA